MSTLLFDVRQRSVGLRDSVRTNFLARVEFVQRLRLEARLPVHEGCVNSLCWSERGDLLLSGSDDTKLVLTNPFTRKVVAS
ncbi:DDB1- and CUL4-associated factor 6-like, partial [Lampetra fluviatilis]